jgi:hypothetical protein
VKTFYAAVQVFYERDGKTQVVPVALLLREEEEDGAAALVEDYLDQHYPPPAYFGHNYEISPLEGVEVTSDSELVELKIVDNFTLASPPQGVA